jgi:hypothetical protein
MCRSNRWWIKCLDLDNLVLDGLFLEYYIKIILKNKKQSSQRGGQATEQPEERAASQAMFLQTLGPFHEEVVVVVFE